MSAKPPLAQRRSYQQFVLVRIILLVLALIATFLFRVAMSSLELGLFRLALVASIVIGSIWLARRRRTRTS
jgi:NADH:ubiquinone oxidoreductase subunit 3 (subunit A)